MGLSPALGRGTIGIDSSVVIYFVERHPTFHAMSRPLFVAAAERTRELATSSLTLLEVLVKPYKSGDPETALKYESILMDSSGLLLVNLDRDQLRTAARLRALYGVRTPDALQLAAALSAGCSAFVTNDRRIPSVRGLPVVQLPDVNI